MPIISSRIDHFGNKQNGIKKIFEEHTDHIGKIHTYRPNVPAGTDYDQKLMDDAAKVEANLPAWEYNEAAELARQSKNPDKIPDHQTQADFDRRVLGEIMRETDAHVFLAALPFFQAVEARGGANANARAAYLGVSRANYDEVAKRFGDVQGAAFFLNDEKNQIWTTIPTEFI